VPAPRNVKIDLLYAHQVLRATLPSPRRDEAPIAIGSVVEEIVSALQSEPVAAARIKLVVFASDRELRTSAPFSQQLDAFERLIGLGLPTAAVVRGQCAGGGLALASFCNFIFAERSASFGGAAHTIPGTTFDEAFGILALKLGAGPALEMLLPGGALSTVEAYRQGLVAAWTAGDSALEHLVQRWIEAHLLPAPVSRLRMANRTARVGFHTQLRAELPVLAQLEAQAGWAAPVAVRELTPEPMIPALWAAPAGSRPAQLG
jgi:enoyl-CoA hydratase/carnithine racemase